MNGQQKAARIHRLLGLIYGLGTTILMLFAFLIPSEWKAMAFSAGVLVALSAMHYTVAHGAEKGRNWARRASQLIAIPLLFGFPIATLTGGALIAASWEAWELESETVS